MLFNSLVFGAFLPIVFAVYWGCGARLWRMQNALVVVASYIFYGWWDARFLGLIVLSSACDFILGLSLHAQTDPSARKRRLILSLIINLGVLGAFKYFNFFVGSAYALLNSLGWFPPPVLLDVLLPVGISFYTFQTLSYTIDIYRGRLEPVRDPIAFFAFVSFFPQLVAGPIERARKLLPQFTKPRQFQSDKAVDGLRQMLWGFVKKVVVADNLAPYVEHAFSSPGQLDGVALLIGAALFSIQLYCDFSGYSDIAIGASRLFGIELSQNFAFPYFARTMREFWRRWHISLSTWFRDYLYIPLGGARHGVSRAAANVLLVFGVSGLWHGANWTFVVWGLLNGLYTLPALLTNRAVPKGTVADGRILPSLTELSGMLITFSLWTLGLIFFRADSIGVAATYLFQMVDSPMSPGSDFAQYVYPIGLSLGLLILEWPHRTRPHGLDIPHWPFMARWALYIILVLVIFLFGNIESREFVYFQF